MIPGNDDLVPDFEVVTQPSYTYKLDMQKARINGFIDGQDAMPQAIYKILTTERYKYVIYSWNYGVELADLFGQPIPYVYAEIERRVTEALTQDDRIESVVDFQFDNNDGAVIVSFTVNTIFGTVEITNFNVEV
ncbi:MAG: DUF2634 domain-containing protein [Alphaproteobacteria bacterium]|nr:DUF2634 domain-containing protein [Alphaproteobacteria bacterium]